MNGKRYENMICDEQNLQGQSLGLDRLLRAAIREMVWSTLRRCIKYSIACISPDFPKSPIAHLEE